MTKPVQDLTVSASTIMDNLPGPDRVGDIDDWHLFSRSRFLDVRAKLLGVASSRRPEHQNHPSGRAAQQDERCAACRWFEPRIFREVEGARRFLVHTSGVSSVPGELPRCRHEWVLSGHEVIEALTIRRTDKNQILSPMKCPVCDGWGERTAESGTGTVICHACNGSGIIQPRAVYLTAPAARVCAQAAQYDTDMDDAWINRQIQ